MKLKKQIKIIQDVVYMVAAYFDLDVDVEIEVGKLRADHHAEVGQESVGFYCIEFSKKFLTTASEEDIIRVAAHEMIHVKQYELDGFELTRNESFFKGQKWLGDYWFSPWEVEARGFELAFLQHYLHYGSESGTTARAAKPTAYRV
tara:strand:+ start:402 stop:839 length:438 start_codon:yes stop_codon:yes gene_type:complete